MTDNLQQQLLLIADEIRGQANVARYFASDPYETERAHTFLNLAAKLAVLASDGISVSEMQTYFHEMPAHVSPAIGVDAAVFNPAGEILLIERADGRGYAMPGGLAEIGLTLPQSALKELWEEVGMRGEVVRLLGVFDGPTWGSLSPIHSQSMVFLVQCDDLTPVTGSEALSAAYFAKDALPDDLMRSHEMRLPVVFEMAETGACFHDPACAADIELTTFQQRDQTDD